MKITVLSTSRADFNQLKIVADTLGCALENLSSMQPVGREELFGMCHRVMTHVNGLHKFINPDLLVLLGDRYETLMAATAAHLCRIPIAHLSGGDLTYGSQDDSMRHAITKLAHIHFPTNEDAARRIRLMGEEPWRVHMVGCPGVDAIKNMVLYTRSQTLQKLDIANNFYLVAYQPATLLPNVLDEVDELLTALSLTGLPCVFTTVNNDLGGIAVSDRIKNFCARHPDSKIIDMDQKLFLSAMKHCFLMIGNSSSGLYEAPSLQKAFVNVGDRQKGRLQAETVVQAEPKAFKIVAAMGKAQKVKCTNVVNPYGDGNSAEKIRDVIFEYCTDKQRLLNKSFNEWNLTPPGNGSTDYEVGAVTRANIWSDGFQETLDIKSLL